jgi:hypothetical protein
MTAAKKTRKPRPLVTTHDKSKSGAFAIGVSASNYHFVTKMAEANGTNRQAVLDVILNGYSANLLRSLG